MKKTNILTIFIIGLSFISLHKVDKSTNIRISELRSDMEAKNHHEEMMAKRVDEEKIEKILKKAEEKRMKAFLEDKKRKEKERIAMEAVDHVRDLQASYPQVKARIQIEGTDIDFPVVQGKDNDFYLDHHFDNSYYINGSVFIDYIHQPDFSDQNTVLYGHNVRIGYIFNDLNKFRDEDFIKDHSEIIIDTPEKRRVFDVVVAMDIKEDENYRYYEFEDDEFSDYLTLIRENNILKKKPLPGPDDKLLTLSTCSDISDRFAIVAVEREETIDEPDLRNALPLLALDDSDRHVY